MDRDDLIMQISKCLEEINIFFEEYKQVIGIDRHTREIEFWAYVLLHILHQHQNDVESDRQLKVENYEQWALNHYSDFQSFWSINKSEAIERAIEADWDNGVQSPEELVKKVESYFRDIFSGKSKKCSWHEVYLDINEDDWYEMMGDNI